MKTKEEIEQLAEKEYREYPNNPIGKEDWHYNKDNNCHRKRKAFVKGYTQCQEDMAKPNHKLIDSMALRYRHDFGLLDKQQQDSIRTTMTQLWEEVVGLGFYSNKQG